jgi:uncharacterized membrane protein HdeD (DUF308 family)
MSTATPRDTATSDAFFLGGEEVSRWWWLYLLSGIIALLYGMLVLTLRPGTLFSLAILAGVSFIIGGVTQFIIAARVESWRWLFYVAGVLAIIAGIIAFAWPGITVLALAVFISWYLAIMGIVTVVSALAGPKRDWWWLGLILGVLEFVLGAWAIGSPTRQVLLMVNIVGIYMIFFGVNEIFAAFAVRSERREVAA